MTGKMLAGVLIVAISGLTLLEARSQEPGGRGRGDHPGDRGVPERPGRGRPGNPLLALFDANRDGLLSAEEIDNAAAVLKKMDNDGDDSLNAEEVRLQRQRRPNRPDGPPRRRCPQGGPEGSRAGAGRPPRGPGAEAGPPPRGPNRAPNAGPPRRPRPALVAPPIGPEGGPPPLVGAIPPFLVDRLDLNDDQREKIDDLSATIRDQLNEILTDEQMEQLTSSMERGPGRPEGPVRHRGRQVGPVERPQRPERP